MTEFLMGEERDVRHAVLAELKKDPRIDEAAIGVQVDAGVVILIGMVHSYEEKLAAQDAAHRAHRVFDVANEIQVELPGERNDVQLARAVRRGLESDIQVPHGDIRTTVSGGWVTLSGTVAHRGQSDAAERVVRELLGVRGVVNQITIAPPAVDPIRIRQTIAEVLDQHIMRELEGIQVTVHDGEVILSGTVVAPQEKEEILLTVTQIPGVRTVEDHLVIVPST